MVHDKNYQITCKSVTVMPRILYIVFPDTVYKLASLGHWL